MSLPRCWLSGILALAILGLVPVSAQAESDFTKFKDLKNEYVKVTNVQERERSEDRYVEEGGKVVLKKMPYKEVMVTAELIRKPPSTMDTMFGSASNPYLKICLAPFDDTGKALDEDCQNLHFQSLVQGNIGTVTFRLTDEMHRYQFHLVQKIENKESSIKLWVPTED